jgi:hypothetical protein
MRNLKLFYRLNGIFVIIGNDVSKWWVVWSISKTDGLTLFISKPYAITIRKIGLIASSRSGVFVLVSAILPYLWRTRYEITTYGVYLGRIKLGTLGYLSTANFKPDGTFKQAVLGLFWQIGFGLVLGQEGFHGEPHHRTLELHLGPLELKYRFL